MRAAKDMVHPNDDLNDELPTEREPTSRRVYVFPRSLADRVVAYQKSKGFGSEVEAVRQILDDYLKSQETPDDVMSQVESMLEKVKSSVVVAKEILIGHPLLKEIKFLDSEMQVMFKDGSQYAIRKNNEIFEGSRNGWVPFTHIPF